MPVLRLFDLSGLVALVTGASSGIGRAIALALAEAGAKLVLVARRAAELEEAKRSIEAQGGAAAVLPCDLADRRALFACAEAAPRLFGAPDIVVSAAGVNIRKPMLEITEADWDTTMRLNLEAPFFLAQKLAPAIIAKRWGRIINIASMQSVRAFDNSGPYGASKGGVMQLTRGQAEAWSRHGVTANAIAPGFFATPLTAPVASDPVRWKQMAERTFVGRNGELDDLRGAAIFLASRASDYVTGQTIFVSIFVALRENPVAKNAVPQAFLTRIQQKMDQQVAARWLHERHPEYVVAATNPHPEFGIGWQVMLLVASQDVRFI